MLKPQIIYATGKVNLYVVIAFFLIFIANVILIFSDIQLRQRVAENEKVMETTVLTYKTRFENCQAVLGLK